MPNRVTSAPAAEYQARLDRWRAAHEALDRSDLRFSHLRLATAAAAVILGILAWRDVLSAWTLVIPAVAFVALVIGHDRVIRARDRALSLTGFYERGIARLEDRWIGTGEPGERFRDDHHPYANDLDLFGPGSLFELLSIARTRAGEETLAGWLMTPADASTVRQRQAAVDELGPALDLRERLSLAGADVRAGVDTDALVEWAGGERMLGPAWLRAVNVVLSLITAWALGVMAATGESVFFMMAILLQMLVVAPQRRGLDHVLHAADRPARDLDILSDLLAELEREQFSSPRLSAIRRELDTDGEPASTTIRRLHRLASMHDWQHNVFFAPFAAVMLWGTHLAWAIEAWRLRHGRTVHRWLIAVGEIEALVSLSAYRYEHPDDPFPEIVEPPSSERTGFFEGTALGHPLLPAARSVKNDVSLTGTTRLLIVSGSNMSGKSTLLRTTGINAVLALCGAPARASALRLTPLVIGATLGIHDSLQEGRSRFYAEITRIRELATLADGPVPLLFLLDELFHGTNSHDRVIGASGVLASLVQRGAIGLVTTHDLAMTRVADELAPRAVNVHFEDWFDGSEMRFDYRVKPGPVTRSNAIALMRAVGLDVGGGN
jgi:hypothetical protein